MPSPIAHIYYGQVYLSRHLSDDPGAFLRGTIFPDIRYLLKMERTRTHRLAVSLTEVEAAVDPWRAGWLFHNWLDEAWSDYFLQFGLDHFNHRYDKQLRVLKLIDDDQLHRLLEPEASDRTADMLERVDEQALQMGVEASDISRWNSLIAQLLRERDAKKTREQILQSFQFSDSLINDLEADEARLNHDRVWPERVRDCRRVITGML